MMEPPLHCHCLNLVLARATALDWELYPQPSRNDALTIIEALEAVCTATGPATAEDASRRTLAAVGSAAVGAYYEVAVPLARLLADVAQCGELWSCMAALSVLKELAAWSASSPSPDKVRRSADGMPLDVALISSLERYEVTFRAAALSGCSYSGLAAELLMLIGTAPAGRMVDVD